VTRSLEPGLAYGDAEGLGQFIRKVLKDEGISTRRAIVDVPRDQAVLNTLTLPEAKDEDLAGMVQFQIVRELPFPIDEAVVDFAAEPPSGEYHQQRVLVAAVRRDILDSYQRVFKHAGLKLERIGLRPYANLVALTHAEPDAGQGRTLFVDVGPTLTEIDIIADGRLSFSRAASVNVLPREPEQSDSDATSAPISTPPESDAEGLELESEAENAVQSILIEVTRTLEAYRATDPEGQMDRIIISGSCGIETELATALEQQLGATARTYHPGEATLRSLTPGEPMTAYAATLGLVLAQTDRTGRRFDFLHPKEPQAARRERVKRIPMIAATVALMITAGGVFFYKMSVQPKRERLAWLSAESLKLKPQAEAVDDFGELLGAMTQWDKNETVWLDELVRVVEVLPDNREAYLTQLSAKDLGRITLKFVASRNQTPNDIAARLCALRDEKGKPIYVARTGSTRKQNDNKYPYISQVNSEYFKAKTDKKRKGRRSRR